MEIWKPSADEILSQPDIAKEGFQLGNNYYKAKLMVLYKLTYMISNFYINFITTVNEKILDFNNVLRKLNYDI
jgi:hypothetical protein